TPTGDDAMVERVAQALHKARTGGDEEACYGSTFRDGCHRLARAALDAAGVPALPAEVERLRYALATIAGATTSADAVPDVRAFARDALAEPGGQSGKGQTLTLAEKVRRGQVADHEAGMHGSPHHGCPWCPAPVVPDDAGLREALVEVAYAQIAVERSLTIMPTGPHRAAVPSHWRDQAEELARPWIATVLAVVRPT